MARKNLSIPSDPCSTRQPNRERERQDSYSHPPSTRTDDAKWLKDRLGKNPKPSTYGK